MSAVPNGVDISSKADAMFVGVMLAPVLCGITISQAWTYYRSNQDGWKLQSVVAALFTMDVTETILTSQMAHEYLIQNFGNLEALTHMPMSVPIEVGVNIVLVLLIELFFAYRVYLLTRQILLPALIILFGIGGFVAGACVIANISRSLKVSALAVGSMKIEVSLAIGFEAISNLLATYALSGEFVKSKEFAMKTTSNLLDKLLAFTIARGGLVTFAQFLTLALYVAQPTQLYWMPIHFIQGKLCVITMLAILNSRDSLQGNSTFVGDSVFTESVLGRQLPSGAAQIQLRSLEERAVDHESRTHKRRDVEEGIRIERVVEYHGVFLCFLALSVPLLIRPTE
ncbi:hypothetical protein FB45DRAFT_183849 [Roridomyces roridus]|uniref:DUF6534 domain-containing protein n=1 Tax=Roridomyces roridus TaxID=1738132 RepID=A0AAD7G020_9AGAR|nr:hypothetical protein FB45DRAFT_183849 [Roridomyces roridus]